MTAGRHGKEWGLERMATEGHRDLSGLLGWGYSFSGVCKC